jgi:hypothetical protein
MLVSPQESSLVQEQNKLLTAMISDPHNVPEVFVTSVISAALISDSSIAVTLGVRRMMRETFTSEPQETVYVVSRIVLTLNATVNLVEMLSGMLARTKSQVQQHVNPGPTTPQ